MVPLHPVSFDVLKPTRWGNTTDWIFLFKVHTSGRNATEGLEFSSYKISLITVCMGFLFCAAKGLVSQAVLCLGNSAGSMATSVTHCCCLSLFVFLPLLSLWWVCTLETFFQWQKQHSDQLLPFSFPFPFQVSLPVLINLQIACDYLLIFSLLFKKCMNAFFVLK